MSVNVSRNQAVEILVGLGYTSAPNMDSDRIATKLTKVAATVDPDECEFDDSELSDVLHYIVDGVGEGLPVMIDEDAADEETTPDAADAADETEEEEEPEAPEEEEAPVETKPTKKAAKKSAAPKHKTVAAPGGGGVKKTPAKGAKKKAAKAPAAPKAPGIPGVRKDTKSRSYFCGLAIAKTGLDKGVTEAMAKKVDADYAKLTGRSNEKETWFALRNSYHAIQGYIAGNA